ncbi:MAG: copper homeostasis periplasmic binding protein CopC [Comamonas sp.]
MPKSAATRAVHSFLLAASCALAAPAAWAHAHLQQSIPAAHATVAAAERIELRFSGPLVARFAKVTVLFLGTDGQAQPVEVPDIAVAYADDQRGVIATPAQPLQPGRYRVEWRVVSADTHPMKGQFSFVVK